MSTPRAGTTTQTTVRPPLKPERTETRVPPETAPPRTPAGPVTEKIEKGSNVWPGFT
jgi:hypothetical protein